MSEEASVMAKRPLFVLSLLTLAAATAAVLAAPRATLTLRNGDKLQTDLVDLGGVGFTVTSGGKTDTIAEAEVAFIDFAGAPQFDTGHVPDPEAGDADRRPELEPVDVGENDGPGLSAAEVRSLEEEGPGEEERESHESQRSDGYFTPGACGHGVLGGEV